MNIQDYIKIEVTPKEHANAQTNLDISDYNKWIEQIPSGDDSDYDFWNNDSNLKFNHYYADKQATPDSGSDINEELSINGTERTSELTTEHWSDTKLCQSQKPSPINEGTPVVYQTNLPSL